MLRKRGRGRGKGRLEGKRIQEAVNSRREIVHVKHVAAHGAISAKMSGIKILFQKRRVERQRDRPCRVYECLRGNSNRYLRCSVRSEDPIGGDKKNPVSLVGREEGKD